MKNIEVEVRSFLSKDKYQELLKLFQKKAELIKEDNQETFYFDCPQDLRIQRNNSFAKIWLKKGKIHDDYREEIEIRFDREQFDQLEELFLSLGHKVEIKWFRKRFQFDWQGIAVCLDHTKGYGYIIELEKITNEAKKEAIHQELLEKLQSLDVEVTPKEKFAEKYQKYKKNWRDNI